MIPRVYPAVRAIGAALAARGIAKDRLNLDEGYAYRSIDDVTYRLAPLLAEHALCILPRVLERHASPEMGPHGEPLLRVAVRSAFDLVSAEDGSVHTVEAYGEALDHGDKATAKAMGSAYKYALLQAFCVPLVGTEDADAQTPRCLTPQPEPTAGWQAWAGDLALVVEAACNDAAIDRLQASHRPLLASLARARPELFSALGERIAARRAALGNADAGPAKDGGGNVTDDEDREQKLGPTVPKVPSSANPRSARRSGLAAKPKVRTTRKASAAHG